jgi:hypothetical protein
VLIAVISPLPLCHPESPREVVQHEASAVGEAKNHDLAGRHFCRPKNVRKADGHSDFLRAAGGIGDDAATNSTAAEILTPESL